MEDGRQQYSEDNQRGTEEVNAACQLSHSFAPFQILPTLLKKIVESLSQGGEENRALGSRALGDLVQRLGNSILTEVRAQYLSETPKEPKNLFFPMLIVFTDFACH